MKEAVFCNFELAYLPCPLHHHPPTPPPPIFPETRRIAWKPGARLYITYEETDFETAKNACQAESLWRAIFYIIDIR